MNSVLTYNRLIHYDFEMDLICIKISNCSLYHSPGQLIGMFTHDRTALSCQACFSESFHLRKWLLPSYLLNLETTFLHPHSLPKYYTSQCIWSLTTSITWAFKYTSLFILLSGLPLMRTLTARPLNEKSVEKTVMPHAISRSQATTVNPNLSPQF